MKYCSNCGKELQDADVFCGNCGTKSEVAAPQSAPEAGPVYEQAAPQPAPMYEQAPQPTPL